VILPLLFNACWIEPKASQVYEGTISYLKVERLPTTFFLNHSRTYKYIIEVQTFNGRVVHGVFISKPIKLRAGDIIRFDLQSRKISELKVLQRPKYDGFI
jgi:hypothetical protein